MRHVNPGGGEGRRRSQTTWGQHLGTFVMRCTRASVELTSIDELRECEGRPAVQRANPALTNAPSCAEHFAGNATKMSSVPAVPALGIHDDLGDARWLVPGHQDSSCRAREVSRA